VDEVKPSIADDWSLNGLLGSSTGIELMVVMGGIEDGWDETI
jgi:hypothetical protein